MAYIRHYSQNMTEADKKMLAADTDGLKSYEYIANHIENGIDDVDIDYVIDNMARADLYGQFLASAARYLHAIDAETYAQPIQKLVAATIDRDREHRYLPEVLRSIYGPDYEQRASELIDSDNNFRRIYKRLYPNKPI